MASLSFFGRNRAQKPVPGDLCAAVDGVAQGLGLDLRSMWETLRATGMPECEALGFLHGQFPEGLRDQLVAPMAIRWLEPFTKLQPDPDILARTSMSFPEKKGFRFETTHLTAGLRALHAVSPELAQAAFQRMEGLVLREHLCLDWWEDLRVLPKNLTLLQAAFGSLLKALLMRVLESETYYVKDVGFWIDQIGALSLENTEVRTLPPGLRVDGLLYLRDAAHWDGILPEDIRLRKSFIPAQKDGAVPLSREEQNASVAWTADEWRQAFPNGFHPLLRPGSRIP